MPHRATIFADGDPCPPSLRNRLRRGRFTIVLDGAAEGAREQGWLPDMVMGDFDSASKATLKLLEKKGSAILSTPDQNFTDLEKALAWCVLRDFKSIWLAQCLGGRVDHSFVNLSLLKRFHSPDRELFLFRPESRGVERVRFARDQKLKLRGATGRGIAVLPFPKCEVHSRGLAFEMQGDILELGVRESSSNHARGKAVDLRIQGEALVVEWLK
jgi:thiamine pyrophosphokinase